MRENSISNYFKESVRKKKQSEIYTTDATIVVNDRDDSFLGDLLYNIIKHYII